MYELLQVGIENKDVFATIIMLIMIFFVVKPANKNAQKAQQKQNEAIIKEMKNGFNNIAVAQNKTKLSDIMIVDVAKQKVWYASEAKLAFIRETLATNNIVARRDRVEKHITSVLMHETSKYLSYLNQFQILIDGELVLVGDYIEENFEMEAFLVELFEVIFREGVSDEIKMNDCRFIMKTYQNNLFEKMRKEIGKI